MPIRPSFRPQIDILEDRTCPSLTLQLTGPDLLISGMPASSLAGLQITGTGGTNFTIKDGVKTLGTFSITRNLTLNLRQYTSPVTLDLNGQALAGNVLLNVGTGNTSGSIRPITILSSTLGGTIDGSVTLNGGSGNETLDFGASAGQDPVRVHGSIQFNGHNAPGGNSNTLAIFDGSSIGGSVSARLVPNVEIGESLGAGAQIAHNLSVNDSGARFDLTLSINGDSKIGGNVSVTGTSQSIAQGDAFVVESGATIVGNLSANLGSGVNLWKLGGTFDGNVKLQGGRGAQPAGVIALNTIELDDGAVNPGTFNGSVTATTGNGSTAFVFNAGTTILGNLSLNFGSGTNDLGGGIFGGAFQGTVAGNLAITLGNGDNTALIATAPGGNLSWKSGSGDSSLTLGSDLSAANSFWKVNLHFKPGTNSLTLDPAVLGNQFLIGHVYGSNGTDTLTNLGTDWSLAAPISITNSF